MRAAALALFVAGMAMYVAAIELEAREPGRPLAAFLGVPGMGLIVLGALVAMARLATPGPIP